MNSNELNSPKSLVESLQSQYVDTYGFVPNNSLKVIWRGLGVAFKNSVSSTINNSLQVLNPPTGSGKTHCLAEYCNQHISYQSGHSILIVVRTILQANELEGQINKRLLKSIAKASYRENSISFEEAQDTPILIITAASYEIYLEWRLDNPLICLSTEKRMGFRGGVRPLTVIDEAFSFVLSWTSDLERLNQVRGHIPKMVSDEFPSEMAFLDKVIEKLKDVSSLEIAHFNKTNMGYQFDMLIQRMRSEKLDRNILDQDDKSSRAKLFGSAERVLKLLSRLSQGFALMQKRGERVIEIGTSLNALPERLESNIIILDATARSNPNYHLLGSRVDLKDFTGDTRDYSNLTIHLSKGHRVGKDNLYLARGRELPNLSKGIADNLRDKQSLLLICHKKLREDIEQQVVFKDQVTVANWGNLDGKNQWKDYQNITMFGMPYRNRFSAILEYFAIKGEKTNRWLTSKSDKPSGRAQIIQSINWSYLVSSIIQALNRCQIRKSINTEGLCPKTDIYILLGNQTEAEFILKEVNAQMPNIKYAKWNYPNCKDKRLGSVWLEKVIAYCKAQSQEQKRIYLKDIKEALDIPKNSFNRLKKALAVPDSEFRTAIDDLKLVYKKTGAGRGLQECFEVHV